MILLIDCGNTSSKYRYLDGKKTMHAISHQEALVLLPRVTEVIYSTVSQSERLNEILACCRELNIPSKKIETASTQFGLSCGYVNYKNLGIDRWLAVLAANALYHSQDVIVVDLGTAMTIDFVLASNQHVGGWISPGLKMSQTSISDKAPGVFMDEQQPIEIIGTDTPSALYLGCVNGLVGSIIQAKQIFESTYGVTPKLILTGGDALMISNHIAEPFEIIEDLVFIGLKRFL